MFKWIAREKDTTGQSSKIKKRHVCSFVINNGVQFPGEIYFSRAITGDIQILVEFNFFFNKIFELRMFSFVLQNILRKQILTPYDMYLAYACF